MKTERLKELLDCGKSTGVFKWKVSVGSSKAGSIANNINRDGYIKIQVDGKSYLAHRLAWLYHYGEWPIGQVDHVNGVKTDNRIENLRDVTHRGNQSNTYKHRTGSTVGTYFHKRRGKWVARITVKGKLMYLGSFLTQLEASEAYQKAYKELDETIDNVS